MQQSNLDSNMTTTTEFHNIKRKIFNRAIGAIKQLYSSSSRDSLLNEHCSSAIDEVKKERSIFLKNSSLNSRKDSEMTALQTYYEEQILYKVLKVIQKNHLPNCHEYSGRIAHTLRSYTLLTQKISKDYESVLRISKYHRFTKWAGANVIITSENRYTENNTQDLSANQRQLLISSNHGDADLVVVLKNQKPLVWLFNQLSAIDISINKYQFYYEIAALAKQYLAENKSDEDDRQALLLICLNKAEALHNEAKKTSTDRITDFLNICKDHKVPIFATGCIQGLKSRLLADLSKFRIEFIEEEFNSTLQNIVMTYDSSSAIPLMESYLKLCNVPYTRPCGPCLQIEKSVAKNLNLLLHDYKRLDYPSSLLGSSYFDHEVNRIDWIHFSRKVTHIKNAGKNNVGWKLTFELSDNNNIDLNNLFGSYSKTDDGKTVQVYFYDSESLDKRIDAINEYKQQI